MVRRITGRSLGDFLAKEIAGPVQADVLVGVPDSEHERCAQIVGQADPSERARQLADVPNAPIRSLDQHALAPLVVALTHLRFGDVNSAAFRRAELPAVNGHMTARGLAAVYDAVLQGRLLSPKALTRATQAPPMPGDWDVVLSPLSPYPRPRYRWGGGFQVSRGEMFGPTAGAFGHGGASGCLGFADARHRIAFAYMTNTHASVPSDSAPRSLSLVHATYRSLGLLEDETTTAD